KHFRQEILGADEQRLIDGLAARGVFQRPVVQHVPSAHAGSSWAPTSATFSNTQKCTLRCTYCYAEGGRLDDLDIPWPAARAAIDLIVENARRERVNPSISFLGEGEATSSWTTFREIIEYFKEQCQQQGFTPTVSLSTNGVFSPSRLDYIA